MLKQFLIVSSACTGLWAASALAQAPAPSPAPRSQSPAPQASPQASPEASPSPAPAAVSQSEIEKFASTVKQFREIQTEAQKQAKQIIEDEQLSVERFQQIQQTQDPQAAQPTPAVTAAERQKFDRAIGKLKELSQSTRQRMDQALQSQGIERERFAQILAQVRQDAGLRARVEERLK